MHTNKPKKRDVLHCRKWPDFYTLIPNVHHSMQKCVQAAKIKCVEAGKITNSIRKYMAAALKISSSGLFAYNRQPGSGDR